jgi:hypothetical protein
MVFVRSGQRVNLLIADESDAVHPPYFNRIA